MERDALEKSRAATLPKDANEYELKLPDNFVAPQGVEFKLNPADPAVGQARAFALKHGLNQDGFSELVGIYGGMRVQEAAAFNRANQAEIEKLGATGTQRVTAIQNFLRGAIGDDLAKPFMQTLCTEAQVRGWEKLMQRVTGQGATGYSHAGRDPPKSRDDIPGYATVSFEQRRAAQERGAGRR
jgi:hypothetical protein